MTDIFPINAVGLYTARDDFAITRSKREIQDRVKQFATTATEKARVCFNLGEDTTEWQVKLAQNDIRTCASENTIQKISYRPFDSRFTYYSGQSRGFMCRPRPELMRHLLHVENTAMCFMRRTREDSISNFFVVRYIVDKGILSSADNANVAPLWLFHKQDGQLFSSECQPNLSPDFLRQLAAQLSLPQVGSFGLPKGVTPEDIFYYAYAVFHSLGYRKRYEEFLKISFPRLPLTGNLELFRILVRFGGELVSLHLLESHELEQPIIKFIGGGNHEVERISWSNNTVWFDRAQTTGFKGVREDVWNFHIGGYQVCEKWLKDCKGRELSTADIAHYQKIVVALSETIRLMGEIDEVIEAHGGWPGAFAQGQGRLSTG